jgi:hypothetical protein
LRAAFDFALRFARTEARGGAAPIIAHQAFGYALADAKAAIEVVRSLSLRAAHAFDMRAPGTLELALHAKVFGPETAVRVIADLMWVVGIDSYDRNLPLGDLLQDALAFTSDKGALPLSHALGDNDANEVQGFCDRRQSDGGHVERGDGGIPLCAGYAVYGGVCRPAPAPGYSNPVSGAVSGEKSGAASGYATGAPSVQSSAARSAPLPAH